MVIFWGEGGGGSRLKLNCISYKASVEMKETYILFIHNNIRGSVWDLQNREQYNRQKVQNKGLKQYRIEKNRPKK